MKKRVIALVFLMPFNILATAGGSADLRQQALARMGELNGVALACRYFDQTRRIKRALIEGLPKQRELGQLFDEQTNESFMAFVNSGKPCPSPAAFSGDVDQAIDSLNEAYAASK